MARTVHADIVTALAASNVQPFYAVNLEFDSGTTITKDDGSTFSSAPVYYWTGVGDLASSANSNGVNFNFFFMFTILFKYNSHNFNYFYFIFFISFNEIHRKTIK